MPSLMRALDGPVAAAARSLGPQLSAPQQCACAASFQAQHQWLAGQHWTRRLMASLSPAEYDKRVRDTPSRTFLIGLAMEAEASDGVRTCPRHCYSLSSPELVLLSPLHFPCR